MPCLTAYNASNSAAYNTVSQSSVTVGEQAPPNPAQLFIRPVIGLITKQGKDNTKKRKYSHT